MPEPDRAIGASLTTLMQTVEQDLARLRQQEPWKAQVPFLIQLPGIGFIGAMTVLAAVGAMTRLASAKQLVGYAGLGTPVHASGQVHRSGGITRAGRSERRTILGEAAWSTIRVSAWWRARYEQLTARMPPNQAIVAIARKLLVVIWPVLSQQVADRQADPVAVARRLFRWGARHHLAMQSGVSRGAFVRRYLDQLGIGQTLPRLGHQWIYLRAPGSGLSTLCLVQRNTQRLADPSLCLRAGGRNLFVLILAPSPLRELASYHLTTVPHRSQDTRKIGTV